MKTFADFKRRLVPGGHLDAVNYINANATGRRRIEKVQTNGFWFVQVVEPKSGAVLPGDKSPVGDTRLPSRVGKRYWSPFPKAKHVRIDGPDTATFLDEDGTARVTITFTPQ